MGIGSTPCMAQIKSWNDVQAVTRMVSQMLNQYVSSSISRFTGWAFEVCMHCIVSNISILRVRKS